MSSQDTNFKIEFNLGLDTIIGEVDYEDGDAMQPPSIEPYRFGDMLVEAIAARFMSTLDADMRSELRSAMRESLMRHIDERVGAIVAETFEHGFPLTNQYGEPIKVGGKETVTLRELIVNQVGKHLRTTGNQRGYDQSPFDKVLAETTEKVLVRDLVAEVKAAKDEIRKRVKASATSVLADAITKGVTG